MTTNLIWGGKPTNLFAKLEDAATPEGAQVTRRAKGFSDHDLIDVLTLRKWVCAKPTGPRGGRRFHITQEGTRHLLQAKIKLGEELSAEENLLLLFPEINEE